MSDQTKNDTCQIFDMSRNLSPILMSINPICVPTIIAKDPLIVPDLFLDLRNWDDDIITSDEG